MGDDGAQPAGQDTTVGEGSERGTRPFEGGHPPLVAGERAVRGGDAAPARESASARMGDIEAAYATAHDALSRAEHLLSARLNEHVREFADELAAAGHSTHASDLTERADTVIRTEP